MAQWIARLAQRWMPDPFLFAILLTLLTWVAGVLASEHGPLALIGFWGNGFWAFLEFGMQMCMILVTGHALASAPPVKRALGALVALPRTPAQAITLVALGACCGGWLNWGFGIIVGALLARDVGLQCRRRDIAVHYPILGAAGYTGMVIWHGGLSGSAPLTVAQEKHSLVDVIGTIPLSQTVFSTSNLVLTLALLLVIPLTLVMLSPAQPEACPLVEPQPVGRPPETHPTPAQRLEHSVLLALAVVAMGLLWLFIERPAVGINTVNLMFLVLGLALHASPKAYADAIGDATSGVSGILLQFPFYAGIMGMMQSSGLIALIANAFVAASHWVLQATGLQVFYWLTFISAGLVNMFIPSGGGQWIVQGPIVVGAAESLQLSQSKAVMAIAYGDQWTNMLQPFWALPLLAITGLQARQLIGYTIPVWFATGILFSLAMLL